METEHVQHLIPDYVLGLLAEDDRARLDEHARRCAACREALRREKQIETLLRHTVQTTARPRTGRLERLRPAPPRPIDRVRERVYRQLAPVTVAMLLLALGLFVQGGGLGTFEPALAQTAAPTTTTPATNTPTATVAAVDGLAPHWTVPRQTMTTATRAPRPGDAAPSATPIVTAGP